MKTSILLNKSSLFLIVILVLIQLISSSPLFALEKELKKMPDPVELAFNAREQYKKIKDYTAIFMKQEFMDGNLLPVETMSIKFRKPFDFYMKWIKDPYKNREMMYRKGKNKGKLIAHEGGFLGIVTVSLNPIGSMAMKKQHHPIFDAGLGPTINLVTRGLRVGLKRKEVSVKFLAQETLFERKVFVFEGIFPQKCEGMTYTIKKGDDLWSIAKRFNQDMYLILSHNKTISDPYDVETGQTIFIPYHYCRKIKVFLDEKLRIPIKLLIYDWEGHLYEMYQYKNLKINVGLTDNDFNPDNKEYHF